MEDQKQIRLTSSEMSQLWTQYMNDSASVCMLTYFLEKAEDVDIKPVIKHALELSTAHVNKIQTVFKEEENAIPHGFKLEEDVDLTAPRLFSDNYVLEFIHQMGKIGGISYALSLAVAVRSDITSFYKECLTESMNLYEMAKDVLLEKGLYIRAPFIQNLEHVDYVKQQGFMWDFFGDKRPLTSLEIANLYSNIQRNALGMATLFGFSQVSSSKDVINFLIKGANISKKQNEDLAHKLQECDILSPVTWSNEVTNSTQYTFSEKLIMFFTSELIAMSLGLFGFSVTSSPRVDLERMYNSFISDIQRYAEDGANIMVKNRWMERPPSATDRDKLARKNYKN